MIGYMCGRLHLWLATCGWLHVWLATCVVGYVWLAMCGWLHVVPIIQNRTFNGHIRSVPTNWEGLFSG